MKVLGTNLRLRFLCFSPFCGGLADTSSCFLGLSFSGVSGTGEGSLGGLGTGLGAGLSYSISEIQGDKRNTEFVSLQIQNFETHSQFKIKFEDKGDYVNQ